MLKRNNRLGMERLEDRQMMAGDVTAFVQNGNLFINEAPAQVGQANNVLILGLPNGQVRVGTTPGGASKVNGQTFQDFTVPGNLTVRLGGGDDVLQLGNDASGRMAMPPRFNQVALDVASPKGSSSKDLDKVSVYGVTTRGTLSINTGVGSDVVQIGGKVADAINIGDGVGVVEGVGDDLIITTGAGADQVNVTSGRYRNRIDIQTYGQAAELDSDRVRFDRVTSVHLDVNVRLGGGDDTLNILDASAASLNKPGLIIGGGLNIDAGAGNDTIYLRNFTIGQPVDGNIDELNVNAGAGADTLTIKNDTGYGRVADDVYVQMYGDVAEADIDTVDVDNVFADHLHLWLGGGDDTLRLDHSHGYVEIDAHDGNDRVEVLNLWITGWLIAHLGKGNDTLRLDNAIGNIAAHGGEEYDRLFTQNLPLNQPTIKSGWEEINWQLQPLPFPPAI